MPSNLMFADSAFPNLTAEQSQEEKTRIILNYLYMLLEQLRYSFTNLGIENFNEAELGALTQLITEPVYANIQNVEGQVTSLTIEAGLLASRISDAEGNITTLIQTADTLSAQMSDAQGDISSLTLTAQGLTTRMSTAEGNISTLTQTANGLMTRVSNAEGAISTVSQTVNSITLTVTNGQDSSQIALYRNGIAISTQTLMITGMVKFSDLSTSGSTIINGDNITSGTITGTTLISCEHPDLGWMGKGKTIRIRDGVLTFGYDTGSYSPDSVGTVYGQIYTDYDNRRFYIWGDTLKIASGGNMSIDAASGYAVYIGTQNGYSEDIHIGNGNSRVYLNGTVYVNNVPI